MELCNRIELVRNQNKQNDKKTHEAKKHIKFSLTRRLPLSIAHCMRREDDSSAVRRDQNTENKRKSQSIETKLQETKPRSEKAH